MCAAINQHTLVWIGPPTQERFAAEFKKLFFKSVQLEADDLLYLDSESNRVELRRELAKRRGLFACNEDLATMPLELLLAPSHRHNYEGYQTMMQDDPQRIGARGSFCADLSQEPPERARCGPWFPTFARSSMVVSMSKAEVYTNCELDFAMGFPSLAFPGNRGLAKHCIAGIEKMERGTYAQLVGNGMHVACLMAFWSFIFAHCVRREAIESFRPMVVVPSDSYDDEWDPNEALRPSLNRQNARENLGDLVATRDRSLR